MTNDPADRVILVDENDQEIGTMDKVEAHRGDGKLHRAISVYLFRPSDKKLLIQQRSLKKIVGASQWANTVCGNVRPGESYQECALRRLREEIGVTEVSIQEAHVFQYQVRCNEEFSENEIDHVFVGWFEREVHLNPDEVRAVDWVSLSELVEGRQKKNQLGDKTLAPWFVWMLEDEKLMRVLSNFTKGLNKS